MPTVRDSAGKVLLWVRPLDSLTAQPLAGTDGAAYPFWSPRRAARVDPIAALRED